MSNNSKKPEQYRNKADLLSDEGIEVEAYSLWNKKGDQVILVDDDQFASCTLDERFQKI